jgi:cobalt-zinc-cadmium efflux system membrane fusion protein
MSSESGQPAEDHAELEDRAKRNLFRGRSRRASILTVVGLAAISLTAAGVIVMARQPTTADGHGALQANPPATTPAGGVAKPDDHTPPPSPTVALQHAALALNAIQVLPVREARLAGDMQVTGNVSYDADHFAIVGPLVAGRVSRLAVGVGSPVRRGQVMAEIESVDVGQARGELISAKARLAAAESNLRRERDLAEKKISSSREREVAEAQWGAERATVRAAHERLRAIGLTEADIEAIDEQGSGGRVHIRAPIDGTVMDRFVTLGQAIQPASDAFKVADLRRVWVQLDLYEKDLAHVRMGLAVEARTEAYPGSLFKGRVAYVAPVVDEATRTAKVRVELDNRDGKLHIGQLISARLIGSPDAATSAVLAIPRSAVQRLDGKPLVFVKTTHGFERRFVELGAFGGELVEIRQGLKLGQEIAADGGFLLKSELLR